VFDQNSIVFLEAVLFYQDLLDYTVTFIIQTF